jgi:hypothetical protein
MCVQDLEAHASTIAFNEFDLRAGFLLVHDDYRCWSFIHWRDVQELQEKIAPHFLVTEHRKMEGTKSQSLLFSLQKN